MSKVRPADGIPVMPHITEQKIAADVAFVKRTYEDHAAEWEKWEKDHPSLAPAAHVVAATYQTICNPAVTPLADAIELMKGLIINFRLALAMAESLEGYMATKQ